jgi:hypothetical protein
MASISVSSRLLVSLFMPQLFTAVLEVVRLMVWPLVRWTFLTPTALMLIASAVPTDAPLLWYNHNNATVSPGAAEMVYWTSWPMAILGSFPTVLQ